MPLVYFIVGLLNIFTQHHNYGIKMDPKEPNFDIRVRRSIENDVKPELIYTRYNLGDILNGDVLKPDILKSDVLKSDVLKSDVSKSDVLKSDVLKRRKRLAYYKKTKITYNDLLKYSPNNNSESQTQKNPYDIFNPNYSFPTRNNQNNNTGVKTGHTINNRQLIRSYPYGHPPGYEPRPNRATGYNVVTTTPVFYNYENPNKPNFGGYGGYTASRPGYENVTPGYYNAPIPYAPRSSPNTNNSPWNSPLAQYPPTYSQNPINNIVSTTNNSGIHNLPYNNNFNNIPNPFKKNNIPQYAIKFNNRTTASNNKYTLYIPVNNTAVTPEKDYIFPSINDYNVPSNNTVSPTNNNISPTNNTLSPTNNISPTNNTSVTPSNVNITSTTTEITLSGCVICNIPCPRFMRRFGMYCRPEDDEDDDY